MLPWECDLRNNRVTFSRIKDFRNQNNKTKSEEEKDWIYKLEEHFNRAFPDNKSINTCENYFLHHSSNFKHFKNKF